MSHEPAEPRPGAEPQRQDPPSGTFEASQAPGSAPVPPSQPVAPAQSYPAAPAHGYPGTPAQSHPGTPAQSHPLGPAPHLGAAGPGPQASWAPLAPRPRVNTLALVAFITSLLGIAPVAVICGHMALRELRSSGEEGRGLALAGVIIGYVVLGVFALLVVWVVGQLIWLSTLSATVIGPLLTPRPS